MSRGDELRIQAFDDAPGRSSPTLLTLPRELRDMIWTEALVRDRIYVTWAFCEDTLQEEHSRTCCRFTRLWNNFESLHTIGTYVGLQKKPKDWLSRVMAFAKGYDANSDADNDQPSLNALLLCRQVFNESAPMFYSQNCFVFCATQEQQSDAWESCGLLPAYAFLKDRSKYAMQLIRRIEIQFLDLSFFDGTIPEQLWYPLCTVDTGSQQSYRHREVFSLLKSNVNLDYLGLYIAGWNVSPELPNKDEFGGSFVTILESLCDLRKVDRLAINYVTRTFLLETEPADPASPQGSPIRCHIHSGHGSQCFVKAAKEAITFDADWENADCGLAHESLRAAAFARLLRHYMLKNGDKKGYQDIRVVMGIRHTIKYLMLSTDDDKVGRSHLEETRDQRQPTPADHDTAEIETFTVDGGSGILDQVNSQGWTPPWATEGM